MARHSTPQHGDDGRISGTPTRAEAYFDAYTRTPEGQEKLRIAAKEVKENLLLHEMRLRAGLLQQDVAERMGQQQQAVSRLENTPLAGMKIAKLREYLGALGLGVGLAVLEPATGKVVSLLDLSGTADDTALSNVADSVRQARRGTPARVSRWEKWSEGAITPSFGSLTGLAATGGESLVAGEADTTVSGATSAPSEVRIDGLRDVHMQIDGGRFVLTGEITSADDTEASAEPRWDVAASIEPEGNGGAGGRDD